MRSQTEGRESLRSRPLSVFTAQEAAMSKSFHTLATPLRCTFSSFSTYVERRRRGGRSPQFDKTLLRDAGLSQPAIDDLRRVFF